MKLIVALLTVLSALSLTNKVFAADWVALPGAGSADQYSYDRSKLVIRDDEITFWKKVVFKVPQDLHGKVASSGLLRERINCTEHTAKLVSYLYYSASGETLEYVVQEDGEPAPIVPDTVGDAFERSLCPLVWHKQEEARIKAEQKAAAAELEARRRDEKDATPVVLPKPEPKEVKLTPAPAATLPSVKTDNEKSEATVPGAPIPMPQIIEQLY